MFLEERVQTTSYLGSNLVVDWLTLEFNGDVSVGQLVVDELNSFDSAFKERLGFLVDETKSKLVSGKQISGNIFWEFDGRETYIL